MPQAVSIIYLKKARRILTYVDIHYFPLPVRGYRYTYPVLEDPNGIFSSTTNRGPPGPEL
jgi:hypothetical protein